MIVHTGGHKGSEVKDRPGPVAKKSTGGASANPLGPYDFPVLVDVQGDGQGRILGIRAHGTNQLDPASRIPHEPAAGQIPRAIADDVLAVVEARDEGKFDWQHSNFISRAHR
jgi:hypothetical protein